MANELGIDYGVTGKTVYFTLTNAVGQVWNGTSFEDPTTANWGNYKIAGTEASTTGIYRASMPSGLSAGIYFVGFFLQVGASAAPTDPGLADTRSMQWDGTAEGAVDVRSIFGNKQAANGLKIFGDAVLGGIVSSDASPTTTSFTANTSGVTGLSSTNGIYAGMFVVFYSGANAPRAYKCSAYSYSAGVGTFTLGETALATIAVNDLFGVTGRF